MNIDLSWLLEWSFKDRNNVLLAHKIHRYPAMFIPELAEKIILAFSKENDVVLDMFSGSGTTILEARKLRRQAKGIEINPLAILISKVKNTYIDELLLEKSICYWQSIFLKNSFSEHQIKNKDFWFHKITNNSINDAVGAINFIEDIDVQDFLKICISEIIREISYCVHSGFKIHKDRKKEEKGLSFNKLEFLDKIRPIIERNKKAIQELKKIDNKNYPFNIYFQDSREKSTFIEDNSVDLILTSPPYGDSRTTVAYGQFSAFSSELFGLKNLYNKPIRNLDNYLLGGQTKNIDIYELNEKSITIKNIQELFLSRILLSQDNKEKKKISDRLKDILAFYNDLDKSISNGYDYLKKEGFFVLVTSSRVVHNTKLHTDNIIAELANNYGLKLKNIYYRDILNKRMPRKVSATNIKGETTTTMTQESIIVLQKT
ncbi:DNA methyltransferase [Gallibacterium anatis]|uniref:DNA methyltransferase n=1 Tax=Gallibacterium anatis TaxID=750 RepID=UPI00254F712C|nr:DNA methyltransferase [Gallibacterium anatis]WIM81875.1 DNA methyltransferase [Gallibacterium anatis]